MMIFTERGLWARHYTEWLMYIVQLLLTTSHETGILPWFDGKIRLAWCPTASVSEPRSTWPQSYTSLSKPHISDDFQSCCSTGLNEAPHTLEAAGQCLKRFVLIANRAGQEKGERIIWSSPAIKENNYPDRPQVPTSVSAKKLLCTHRIAVRSWD